MIYIFPSLPPSPTMYYPSAFPPSFSLRYGLDSTRALKRWVVPSAVPSILGPKVDNIHTCNEEAGEG